MRKAWRFVAVLVAIWLVAGGVVWLTRAVRPTPESVSAYIDRHPIGNLPAPEREKVIAHVAAQFNRLNFEQRQELRKLRTDHRFLEQMSPAERQRFLDLTLPEGFRQLMLALNKMDPEKRRKLVQKVLDDMEKEYPTQRERIDDQAIQKIISQGMDSFYQDASADVKLEFAPVIEQLQRSVQGLP